MIATVFILSALLASTAADAEYAGSQSPVGIPEFHFKNGNVHWSGKAFAIQWFNHRNLLLCPLHCLTLNGTDIDPKTVPDVIQSVDVLDLQKRDVIATAGHALLRQGASVAKKTGSLAGDMMAFELPSHTQFPILGLAPNLAPVGTRVWVLSKAENSQSTEVDQYPGTVIFSFEVGLTVKLDRPLDAPGSSGAPVLDAKNQLVGMMVGTQDNKRINIAAIPSTTIYKRLFTEVGR